MCCPRSPSSPEIADAPEYGPVDPAKGVLEVEWPLYGELSRALALKVSRDFDPELVVGIANAGVIPGATIASILNRDIRVDDRQSPLSQRNARARNPGDLR